MIPLIFNNKNNLCKLNTRLKISIVLIIVLSLLTYQLFIVVYHPEILNKQWWSYSHLPNKLGDEVVLKNVSSLQQIQYDFPKNFIETPKEKEIREYRKESIKQGFLHAWNGYVKYAWGSDEVVPVTNQSSNYFNGWGATMVDSLDTLWIMGLKEEFTNATEYITNVNFTISDNDISVFETVIRYLGGLLSAYELSHDEIFLQKAKELGEAIIPAFNSPTGLPYNNWNLTKGLLEDDYRPHYSVGILAQVGTLQLEYMKLAQLTGNSSFFYKVQNITDVLDKADKLIPGLYPLKISQETGQFIPGDQLNFFTFGGSADSFYEYLIKQHIFVGGAIDQYRRMYEESIDSMHEYLIREGQVKDHPDLLFIGQEFFGFIPSMEHLSCFVPGMLAIGSKVLNRPKDLEVAIKLEEACYWAYDSTLTGLGPEAFYFLPKNSTWTKSQQDDDVVLPDGMTGMNGNYYLRPETIESLFILYRVTGDKSYQEKGWKIWQSIEKWCKTETAYSGLNHVSSKTIKQNNNMESTPDVISLDTYVFNTEAHPFLRMKP